MAVVRQGRADIYIESDGQYTVLAYKREDGNPEVLLGSTGNLTLANAFNSARDSMAALATGAEKHAVVTVKTTITDS